MSAEIFQRRFWSYVDASGDCWEWNGGVGSAGYGVFYIGRENGRKRFEGAHRFAWQTLVGPITDGLTIDHLCKNKTCVNPDHMELVTLAENSRRNWMSRANRSKTHCKHGHPFSEENTRIDTETGHRACWTCRRRISAEYNARVSGLRGVITDPYQEPDGVRRFDG